MSISDFDTLIEEREREREKEREREGGGREGERVIAKPVGERDKRKHRC